MGDKLPLINYLVQRSIPRGENMDRSSEGVRLIVNLAQQASDTLYYRHLFH